LFGGAAKAEPQHDPWPPTYRLPSGAVRVEASFKEPARQKLVHRATKAVAFLALAFIVLGHDYWPWPDLARVVLHSVAGDGPVPATEMAAARLFVAVVGVAGMVGTFRLLLAALGFDRGSTAIEFHRDRLLVDGRAFDRRSVQGFELEPHHFGKIESHNEKRLGRASNLYYRDTYTIIMQYAERRIEVAHMLGRKPAAALVARFQELNKRSIEPATDRHAAPADLRA